MAVNIYVCKSVNNELLLVAYFFIHMIGGGGVDVCDVLASVYDSFMFESEFCVCIQDYIRPIFSVVCSAYVSAFHN